LKNFGHFLLYLFLFKLYIPVRVSARLFKIRLGIYLLVIKMRGVGSLKILFIRCDVANIRDKNSIALNSYFELCGKQYSTTFLKAKTILLKSRQAK
jgi:hypothetical protein